MPSGVRHIDSKDRPHPLLSLEHCKALTLCSNSPARTALILVGHFFG